MVVTPRYRRYEAAYFGNSFLPDANILSGAQATFTLNLCNGAVTGPILAAMRNVEEHA
jgi:hypothetical protein